jgi:hypothetical protein
MTNLREEESAPAGGTVTAAGPDRAEEVCLRAACQRALADARKYSRESGGRRIANDALKRQVVAMQKELTRRSEQLAAIERLLQQEETNAR